MTCNPGVEELKEGEEHESCCYFFRVNDKPFYSVKHILDRAGYPSHDDGMTTFCANKEYYSKYKDEIGQSWYWEFGEDKVWVTGYCAGAIMLKAATAVGALMALAT